MAHHSGYLEDVLEQLEPLGPVHARRMFGGWGLFLEGRMFALILGERLYFKTDDTTRAAFESAGGEPFVYSKAKGKAVTLSYWTPPPDAVDDALALLPWARRALESSRRAAALKPRASRPSSRPGRASPRPRRTS